jgi:hypothetical protein
VTGLPTAALFVFAFLLVVVIGGTVVLSVLLVRPGR